MFYIICSFKTLEEGVGESLDLENKKTTTNPNHTAFLFRDLLNNIMQLSMLPLFIILILNFRQKEML